MKDYNLKPIEYSARSGLCAIGLKLQQLDLLAPIHRLVEIPQKTVQYTPLDKLMDAFIGILAGSRGIVEINNRLRTDRALQRAFGRESCAEQSTVQDTLNACQDTTVVQMEQAVTEIYQRHSLAINHNYRTNLQLLDIDLTGLPCGPKAEKSLLGYFDGEIRYGRQIGRVIAAHYQEIVIDRLYPGNTTLTMQLRELIAEAEEMLELDTDKIRRTVLRIDAGGGSVDDINWMLRRGYHLHCKSFSSHQAEAAAEIVKEWIKDNRDPSREYGWANISGQRQTNVNPYACPTRRIAPRCYRKDGRISYTSQLVSTLEPAQVISLMGLPVDTINNPAAVLRAYVHLYDKRAGAIEISIKEDKQGIGITKRRKKRFAAQQMVMLLSALAHNVIIWSRHWLARISPRFLQFGILRMIRDVYSIPGLLKIERGLVVGIIFDDTNRISDDLVKSLRAILPSIISFDLGYG